MIDFIQSHLESIEDELISIRRYLHQHPELSWKEYKTTSYICELFEKRNITPHRLEKTGLYVDFIVDDSKPIIIYRADIDALPIHEETGRTYSSHNEGVAHMCGHDFHTTVAIGLVFILDHFKDKLVKNIRVLFQPAEEVIPSGAQSLADSKLLDNVDHMFAIHSEPNLESGKISIVDDWVTTQFINYYITFTGETGHVAHPYRSNDVIFTAAQLITQLYSHINRTNRYDAFYTMTMSMIEAGTKINVIPKTLQLNGSLRISKPERTEEIREYIDDLIRHTATLNQVDVHIDHKYGPPPVVNHAELSTKFREIAKTIYQESDIHSDVRTMGSEDFSFYLSRTKGCYMRVGVSTNDHNYSLHSSKFDIDEAVIRKTTSFIALLCFTDY